MKAMTWPNEVKKDLVTLVRLNSDVLGYEVYMGYDDSVKEDYIGQLILEGEARFVHAYVVEQISMDYMKTIHDAYIEVLKVAARSTH